MKPALVALLLALAVAGCGTEESTETSPGAGTTAAAPTNSEEPATSLTIEVAQTGFDHGVTQTTTLECDPVGGSNPLSAEACAPAGRASRGARAGSGRHGVHDDLRRP